MNFLGISTGHSLCPASRQQLTPEFPTHTSLLLAQLAAREATEFLWSGRGLPSLQLKGVA
jgi:hypothetical protein